MSIVYRKHNDFPESILIRDFVGKVNVDEIISSWDDLLQNGKLDEKLKGVINVLDGCDLEMNMQTFGKLIAYLKAHSVFKNIKLAVVCDCPKNIVFPSMGEFLMKDLSIKPFSSVEFAVSWINE